MIAITTSLAKFGQFCQSLKRDEKGESQIFLDRWFRAFGHGGAIVAGEDLNKHSSQAFEDWTRLVPDRPRYVLLCNFNKLWIFDFVCNWIFR